MPVCPVQKKRCRLRGLAAALIVGRRGISVVLRPLQRSQAFLLDGQQAERVTHGRATGESPGISGEGSAQTLPLTACLLDHRTGSLLQFGCGWY